MGRHKNNKRKYSYSSGSDSVNQNNTKIPKQRGPSSETQISDTSFAVSAILGLTNSILYGDKDSDLKKSSFFLNSGEPCNSPHGSAMTGAQPTLKDVMRSLEGISGRLTSVENKLQCLNKMDQRMASLEKDIKSLWLSLEDRVKKVDERVSKLENFSEGADIAAAQVSSRLELERERDSLRDDLTYIKSQSMRNNLIFTGVPEVENESSETTEKNTKETSNRRPKDSSGNC
ncbi:hypothetical protein DPMN_091959 [Dreissena polymorpha]|uniref:Uncharacterized protein n=1 Tax=Dreissena polymorpha TaxID=45954 RepID=A0A9D4QZK2_DREPO|nr:hypothetical protein DPMN_091959 [Dreissena polymorpha]